MARVEKEYAQQLESINQTLTEKLEASERVRAGALALINVMRTKYKIMRNTTDGYEYWSRSAEYDSLMKYDRVSNTKANTKELEKIYNESKTNADKQFWDDKLTQEVEKDAQEFLRAMREELENMRR